MTMTTLRLFALILFTALSVERLWAQGLPTDLENLGGEPATEKVITVMPEANNLRVEWWRYFDVPAAELEAHIEQLKQHLNEVLLTLAADDQPTGQELRDRILSNLQALAKLREQKPPQAAAVQPHQQSYSIEAWLDLESRYRRQQKEVTDQQAAINQLARAVDGASRQYDTEMAAYIKVKSTDPAKVLLGLDIMATRSALELARERLSRQRKESNVGQAALEALEEEKKVAAKALRASDDAIPELLAERAHQEKQLAKASKSLIRARSRVLGAIAETPEALASNRLQEQQALQIAVDEASTRLRLTLTAQKLGLTRLLAEDDVELDSLRQQLSDWQALGKESSIQLDEWRAESLREQSRSQTQLLSQPPLPAELQKIHEQRNKLAQQTLLELLELEDLHLNMEALTEITRLALAKREGLVKHWWISSLEVMKSAWQQTSDWFTESLFKIGDTPVTLFGLFRVLLILAVAWAASSLLRRMLAKLAERSEGESSALYTVGRLAHYLILLVGTMFALSSIGLDFSNLALVAGALSVGIGFGLQSIVNNFVSGLILLFEQSLKVGDFIELDSGVLGVVKEINVRSTLVNTNDNVDIIVPNSELVSAKVTNWTLREATRRLRIPFGVAYGTDKELVKKAILEAADRVPVTLKKTLRHDPQVWLVRFGESSLDFELVVWVSQAAVKRPGSVVAAYMWEIETSLSEYGIEIPFPQRDLHVRSLFEKHGNEAEALLHKGTQRDKEAQSHPQPPGQPDQPPRGVQL